MLDSGSMKSTECFMTDSSTTVTESGYTGIAVGELPFNILRSFMARPRLSLLYSIAVLGTVSEGPVHLSSALGMVALALRAGGRFFASFFTIIFCQFPTI